ncbi:N-acetylmuramoyl-L-alanine amidase [uncultured Microscilla sp.]|uniref:N-acetylmuramoyl-L-alanine amidase family protein n=1 Tax=uncultured Microscilla sp. TaxID=432653 RepID=UPI002617BC3A|nr:N-acetylmuramoyl-L-alanine amidase [uncultured Microscilla sp.]
MHIRLLSFGVVIAWLVTLTLTPGVAQKKKRSKTIQNKGFVLVIDPGHGGKDTGRLRGSKSMKHEKSLNLAIALKLGKYVKKYLPHIKVYYTRTTDRYLSLEDRVDFAHDKDADAFISLHCNSVEHKQVHGTELHIHSFDLPASKYLAKLINKQFKQRAGRKVRGIYDADKRQKNFYVVQYTRMPSVLVECGYMTNTREEKYLNSDQGQSIIASAIFRAFRAYTQSKRPRERREIVYQVQLMATQKPIPPDSEHFKDVPKKVKRVPNKHSKKYKYRYVTGWEYTLKGARRLLNEIHAIGFKEAFLVASKSGR